MCLADPTGRPALNLVWDLLCCHSCVYDIMAQLSIFDLRSQFMELEKLYFTKCYLYVCCAYHHFVASLFSLTFDVDNCDLIFLIIFIFTLYLSSVSIK